MNNAVYSNPSQFGLLMNAAFADPSIYSDGSLNNYNTGLTAYLNAAYANSFSNLNPFASALGNINWNFDLNWGALNNINLGLGLGTVTSLNDPYKTQTSDQAKFERKVKLVLECGDYEEEIAAIRNKMGGNYKKGIKEIDKLIKTIDSEELHDAAKSLYEEDFESAQEKAANIANNWATQIYNQGMNPNFKVSMSGVTKDNILDVLGNFLTNEKVTSNAVTWKTLIENNFKQISKVLISKAKEMKKEAKDDATKQAIDNLITQVKGAKTPENEINTTYELFKKLREIQTKTSDAEAFSRYGIPQDKIDSNQSLTVAQDKFKEETEEYTKQKAHLDKNA